MYLNGGGSGGALMALDAATGAVRWSRFICCGDHSPPALAGGRLYVGYSCDAYAVDAATGQDVWHVNEACSGGGGKAVVVHGGRVYTRDSLEGVVRDAGTGAALRTFSGSTAPAIWDDTAYFVTGETLYAAALPDLAPRWSFSDTGISIAPIVVNGTVIAGSMTGHLYALDGTGRVFTPRRDKARRKVVSAYLARGETEPWQLVAHRHFRRLRHFTATVTLRFPPGSLGRGDHWMLCLPERRSDAYGRPTEIERRCGAAEIPRSA